MHQLLRESAAICSRKKFINTVIASIITTRNGKPLRAKKFLQEIRDEHAWMCNKCDYNECITEKERFGFFSSNKFQSKSICFIWKNLGEISIREDFDVANAKHFPVIPITQHLYNVHKPHNSRYISPRITRDPPTGTKPSVREFIVDRDNRFRSFILETEIHLLTCLPCHSKHCPLTVFPYNGESEDVA